MNSFTPTQTRYRVGGMDCGSCAAKIETALRRIDGVTDVEVSVTAGTMNVSHRDDGDLRTGIAKAVTKLGYTAAVLPAGRALTGTNEHKHDEGNHDHAHDHGDDHSHDHSQDHSHDHGTPHDGPWWQSPRAQLTLASGGAIVVATIIAHLFPAVASWAFIAAMAVGLVPIAQRAIVAARAGSPFSIEMLMTIAAIGAVLIGAAEEAAAVVVLFLIGELLEGVAAGRARAGIKSLSTLVPKTAQVEQDGATSEVSAGSLTIGSVILVRPGDRLPADGEIISGESSIDEAPVTGESTPKRKRVSEQVFAGTINLDGAIRVRVSAAASDNTIARVVRLVEEAQESKAPTERFIERFSRYYTPAVLALGALVAVVPPLLFGALWSAWIYKGLAILLIGCPCALVISTPAAIAAGLSSGARRGLLMKGGAILETARRITMVAFDKTGTLTEGHPKVTDVIAGSNSATEVLSLAAALETGSNHPLAKAILARAAEDQITIPSVTAASAVNGKGILGNVAGTEYFLGSEQASIARGANLTTINARIARLNDEGKTVSILLSGTEISGILAMRDEPRLDAKAGISALTARGITCVMLTGDNRRTAEVIARTLGLEAKAELLPDDKLHIVQELKRSGEIVAKVGDGINDSPALAAADIGIAMGGGTDVALETADAAILHGRVSDVATMIDLSRKTMTNIQQNIVIALGLKVVFLVTTIAGITGLWPAILADTGATVLVTLNALRLLQPGASTSRL